MVILLVEALGLKWISVWNPTYIVVCSPRGLSFKSACGEPPAKRMTGLFYLSTFRLSGPLWASLGLSQPASPPTSQPANQPSVGQVPWW